MLGKYILVDKQPVEEPDVLKWGEWFETADRRVAETDVDGVRVSTVFLGIDHNFEGEGEPVLFETMTFADRADLNGWQFRYETMGEAEEGHREVVDRVRRVLNMRRNIIRPKQEPGQ